MDLNSFVDSDVVRDVETNYGFDMMGVELKHLLKESGNEIVIAYGWGKNPENYSDKDDEYDGKDIPIINTTELWQNTSELTPDAAVRQGKTDKDFSFSTTFLASGKDAGGEWYKDLGYNSTRSEEEDALSEGVITESSYIARRGGRWFNGNSVIKQKWYYVPAVILSYEKVGKTRQFTVEQAVWLKLKASARGQSGDLMKALATFKERNDTSVYGGLIRIERDGNFYNMSAVASDVQMDDETRELVEEYLETVTNFIGTRIKTIFEERHDSHPMTASNRKEYEASNNAVREFLTTRTADCETWEDFVQMYNIFANPIDISNLEAVPVIADNDIPF